MEDSSNRSTSPKKRLFNKVLSAILLILIVYVALEGYGVGSEKKLQLAANEGYKEGRSDAIKDLYQGTHDCQVFTFSFDNVTRTVADVNCVEVAIKEQLKQEGLVD